MKKIIYILILFALCLISNSQTLQLKINNKTGYDVDSIELSCKYIGLVNKDSFVTIKDCNEMTTIYGSPFGYTTGSIKGKNKSLKTPRPLCGKMPGDISKVTEGKFEYDILLFEDETGYTLIYQQVPIKEFIPQNTFAGTFFPINKEGDKLAAICKEGILKINEDNTFAYILTPDKTWCPDMKEFIYEGSCEEKNDTLYLYNKEFKTPLEPHFSILDVDTGNTVLISLFNEAGEAINIEDAHSINSAQKTANTNKIKIPFKKNIIEIKDKRIFGITIYPIAYPEVQIVLKKIRASAKINIILSATYYESVFNGRKFILEKNILSEVGGTGISTNRYIKN